MKIRNYLCSGFPFEKGLKQGDALSPLLFNFALEFAIRKAQETIVLYCIDGVVIAVQCTATFSDLCFPEFGY